jgi:hypothetical protein
MVLLLIWGKELAMVFNAIVIRTEPKGKKEKRASGVA